MKNLLAKMFGTANERTVNSLRDIVQKINAMEPAIAKLSDEELSAKTGYFKTLLAQGATLDDILPEAFAVVREASKRVLKMRHFDVQLIGGMVLHKGMISEMKTGEGKTLVATLPAYLNALTGKGVHIVTTNDYLAHRDAEWMGKLYKFLGLSVGCIMSSMEEDDRRKAYQCDITNGTNNEFGFDFLRDNLKVDISKMVQREFNFAIVDEVDSILIDEARTPLIISGPTDNNSDLYIKAEAVVKKLVDADFEMDEKAKAVMLNDRGNEHIEMILKQESLIANDTSLYDFENMTLVHHINQALKAQKIFKRDVDYIVKDRKVMIIDEFTGRIMDGRRYSDGLHQALEAKEGVEIQNENQTLASITFQNYFRMYPKLAGMTGTAMTEAQEFSDIYKLETIAIPTNISVSRKDEDDEIYITLAAKDAAILKDIETVHKNGQPVLIGTISIEQSEHIAKILKEKGIKHNVLNARYHEQEAAIIAQAGRFGAVTIATNMAGRGTDIQLGGNPDMLLAEKLASLKKSLDSSEYDALKKQCEAECEEDKAKVLKAGGLYVIGTERHESRRIYNQLRGRSGRQGDPGKTKFYLSMEDNLMRIFGSDKIKALLTKLGLKEEEVITHPWINKSLEKAQQKVEAHNYDVRKTLLRFDDVMNEQRKVIYEQRRFILTSKNLLEYANDIARSVVHHVVSMFIQPNSLPEEWDIDGLNKEILRSFNLRFDLDNLIKQDSVTEVEVANHLENAVLGILSAKKELYGLDVFGNAVQHVMAMTLDHLWKEHLHTLDHLRTGIGLRAYAQKDPLNEYKMEAFNMFKAMLEEYEATTISRLCFIEIAHDVKEFREESKKMIETRNDPSIDKKINFAKVDDPEYVIRTIKNAVNPEDRDPNDPDTWGKVARNDECPCGSGKKYKQCHGAI
ncbi:MAG: preprotein translocase subunit SecA [Alphaproteobacteria bacterium]